LFAVTAELANLPNAVYFCRTEKPSLLGSISMSTDRHLADLDELNLLQQQLALSQRAELEALLALTSYTRAHGTDLHRYEELTVTLSDARERHRRFYAEWKALATQVLGDL
jgi:hypothetical protein